MKRLLEIIFEFLFSKNESYYINGAETLPPPLTPEEEASVIERCADDESQRKILIEHNLRLVVYIAKKFENTGIGLEDLISIGTIGLIKSVNTYHAERNIKLATYASRCIENEILMYIRKNMGKLSEISIDEPLNTDWDGNELLLSDVLSGEENVMRDLEYEEDRKTVHDAVNDLDEREREIIKLRFGMDGLREHTQKEVADMLNISQSYISRLEKRITERLKDRISGKI